MCWHELHKVAEETMSLALLRGTCYDVFCGFVAFMCLGEVLWMEESSIDWLPYSWDTADVSTVPDFDQVSSKGKICGPRCVVE